MDKLCRRCKQTKPISEFYYKGKLYGYASHCKECCREKQRAWHNNNPDYNKEYGLDYRLQDIELRRRVYDPIKAKARNAVTIALKQKKLTRASSCEMCGKQTFTQAHHDDYTKLLDVRWLCVTCHNEVDRGPYENR